MNKLASTFYLESLGVVYTPIFIVKYPRESNKRIIQKRVEELYDSGMWVIRSGFLPDMDMPPEKGFPWNYADNLDLLIERVLGVEQRARFRDPNSIVFIHPQREMVSGGVLLVREDSTLAIEVVKGDKKTPTFMKLAELTKGRRNPEGIYEIVGPLRVGYELQGKEILIPSDLAFLRYMERQLDYEKIGSLTQATAVEFSVRSNGKVECHDIN